MFFKEKTLIFDMDETLIHCTKNEDAITDYILSIPISKTESH